VGQKPRRPGEAAPGLAGAGEWQPFEPEGEQSLELAEGLGGRSMRPRFMFSWPNATSAVLPPAQMLAASAHRSAVDETSAGPSPSAELLTAEASALHQSGQVHDDGVIDPRDTRTVLGICLSVLPPVATAGRAA